MTKRSRRESNEMASPIKQKSAMDELLDTFGEVIDSGAKKMDPAELRESEKRFNEIADRAAAGRKPRNQFLQLLLRYFRVGLFRRLDKLWFRFDAAFYELLKAS